MKNSQGLTIIIIIIITQSLKRIIKKKRIDFRSRIVIIGVENVCERRIERTSSKISQINKKY